MSSPSRGCDELDRWDEWIGSTLKNSVADCTPSVQVRWNLLQAAAVRQANSSPTLSAEQQVRTDWSGPWSLWAIYSVYIDLHRSVIR